MPSADVLKEIHRLVQGNRYEISAHAAKRAIERGAGERDIVSALITATRATWQEQHQTWNVEGEDTDGDPLTVAVVIEAYLVVVTLF